MKQNVHWSIVREKIGGGFSVLADVHGINEYGEKPAKLIERALNEYLARNPDGNPAVYQASGYVKLDPDRTN